MIISLRFYYALLYMNEIDVLEELMKDDPFLRLYPTFSSYLKGVGGIQLDLALEFYASHLPPEEAMKLVGCYK